MDSNAILSWRAPEHQHTERGTDWYWALGIIALSSAITAIIFSNLLFALLIVIAAGTLGIVAHHKPEEVDFELSNRGLSIGADEFYPYDHMFAFWVGGGEKPTLLIDTPRFMTPDLVIPIEDVDPDIVREILLEQGVPEVPLRESLYYKIMEFLGF